MSDAKRKRFLWILFLAGIGLVVVVAASGTTLVALPFDQLAGRATAVARVRCVGMHTLTERGEIWTETQFQVLKSQKGSLSGVLTVRMPGGLVDGLHAHVDGVPVFQASEEAYLFLWAGDGGTYRVLGWTQGTFRIQRDARSGAESVTQDSANAPVFDPATRTFRKEGIRRMSVERFEEKLRGALASRSTGR